MDEGRLSPPGCTSAPTCRPIHNSQEGMITMRCTATCASPILLTALAAACAAPDLPPMQSNGQIHTFDLDAEMFFLAEVDQISNDFTVTVTDPGGEVLREVDGRTRGIETIRFETEAAGAYEVAITAADSVSEKTISDCYNITYTNVDQTITSLHPSYRTGIQSTPSEVLGPRGDGLANSADRRFSGTTRRGGLAPARLVRPIARRAAVPAATRQRGPSPCRLGGPSRDDRSGRRGRFAP